MLCCTFTVIIRQETRRKKKVFLQGRNRHLDSMKTRIVSFSKIKHSSNDVFAKCTLTLSSLGCQCLVLVCLVLFTSHIPE